MLIFKELNNENLIKDFLNEFEIPYKRSDRSIFFGGFEDDVLFGICKINISIKQQGILDYLLISNSFRGDNLGNSLLRASLNNLDILGIKEVLYLFNNDYLLKKGFVKREKDLLVKLPDFLINIARIVVINNEVQEDY